MTLRTQAIGRTMTRTATSAFAAAVTSVLIAATPALALDDGDQGILETMKGLAGYAIGFGMGSSDEDEKPRIQYRERAPLVLPPKTNLPQPGVAAADRNPNWPKDYDEDRRQRVNAARARTVQTDGVGTNMMSNAELARGRVAPGTRDVRSEQCGAGGTNGAGDVCDTARYWSVMKNTRKLEDTSRDVVAGSEPARKALTDPPTGYRRATTSVKYVAPAPSEPVDVNDPRAQLREDQRIRRERSE